LCLYPFIQKYFVKGIMIRGIKGQAGHKEPPGVCGPGTAPGIPLPPGKEDPAFLRITENPRRRVPGLDAGARFRREDAGAGPELKGRGKGGAGYPGPRWRRDHKGRCFHGLKPLFTEAGTDGPLRDCVPVGPPGIIPDFLGNRGVAEQGPEPGPVEISGPGRGFPRRRVSGGPVQGLVKPGIHPALPAQGQPPGPRSPVRGLEVQGQNQPRGPETAGSRGEGGPAGPGKDRPGGGSWNGGASGFLVRPPGVVPDKPAGASQELRPGPGQGGELQDEGAFPFGGAGQKNQAQEDPAVFHTFYRARRGVFAWFSGKIFRNFFISPALF
jgi:hypothetical protein